jgi:hypothetical protein
MIKRTIYLLMTKLTFWQLVDIRQFASLLIREKAQEAFKKTQ